MNMYLEHANLTVRNLDRAVRFLRTALPEVRIRGKGVGLHGPWLHIGTDESYLALEEASQDRGGLWARYADPGVNHLGFVVEDADGVRKRLRDAGYREGIEVPDHPFRQRVYFFDDDDNEFEFVQYRSTDPAERNDYSS
jgi:catechol 2,3-dioxygenase-like lactoylglutathione lyase family enzyme